MSGFDDLERQLRGAVRERASKAPAGRRRWRTGRALALAATLVVPAGASPWRRGCWARTTARGRRTCSPPP
jgi:hypothetical protein